MEDILMDDTVVETEGEEVQEPAESAIEGEEVQELAEPVSEKNDADAAFAEMRRRAAAAEAEAAAARRERDAYQAELGRYFSGEDPLLASRAYAEQRSVEEIRAEIHRENEMAAI